MKSLIEKKDKEILNAIREELDLLLVWWIQNS